ncbi:hypothetical protein MPSEU_000830500 [Mayamaea pseudoterrestris]|nr:hypothetical protein MPSEU_000830500 [Mayamaea pseudoterrestris]
MLDDKTSDRGDVAAHKRHGRQYTPQHGAGASSTGLSSSNATAAGAAASSFSTMMRRYAPSFSYSGTASRKQKLNTSNTGAAVELYSMRDKTDATAKRTFRVQIPVRLMYIVLAVFLIIPILVFGWKETHLPNKLKLQQEQAQTVRLRRSDAQARQDSNWMEEHLLTNSADMNVQESVSNVTINEADNVIVVGPVDAEASRSKSIGLPDATTALQASEAAATQNATNTDPANALGDNQTIPTADNLIVGPSDPDQVAADATAVTLVAADVDSNAAASTEDIEEAG